MGQVVGATNRFGEFPAVRPITVSQVLASVYRAIGIDPGTPFPNANGHPVPLLEDRDSIHELT